MIISHLPPGLDVYAEGCMGGLAVGLRAAEDGLITDNTRVICGDVNMRLWLTYRAVQEDPEKVYSVLAELLAERERVGRREHFYAVRERFNNFECVPAGLIYLQTCGFRGLYRENLSGICNTPFGDHKLYVPGYDHFRDWSRAVQAWEFSYQPWQKTAEEVLRSKGVRALYMDPPYVPLKTGGFTSYSGPFPWEEQVAVADYARRLSAAGVTVLVSNHDLPEVRDLYTGADIYPIQEIRVLNVAKKRKPASSLLAVWPGSMVNRSIDR